MDPSSLKLAVGRADVMRDIGFHLSMAYWQTGRLQTGSWTHHSSSSFERRYESSGTSTVLIEGDCSGDVIVANGSLVHIYGDLTGNITAKGQAELVIAGDCGPNSCINADGIVRVFVGGSSKGKIISKRSVSVWVEQNCSGSISTGSPSTHLFVMGDFSACVKPTEKASLLYLAVFGFAQRESIEAIAQCAYTQFNGTISVSDCAPGIYPDSEIYNHLRKMRSHPRWVVHRRREGNGRQQVK